MYKIPYYTEEDPEIILAFMKEYSFAVVAGIADQYPVATHLPLDIRQVDGKIIFTGHMMKNTDHHKAFLNNNNVLVIFNGPHCHISASWYPKPDVGSTWNYITVHAKGKIHFGSEDQTRMIIEDLTNKYEHPGSTAAFNKLSEVYVDRMVKAINGFTIEVESHENVFKLSQNYDSITRNIIVSHLDARGDENSVAIAKEVRKRISLRLKKIATEDAERKEKYD